MKVNSSIAAAAVALLLFVAGAGQRAEGAPLPGQSLFPDSKHGNDSGPEGTAYELGTLFRANLAGTITQIRVFAIAAETGQHVARLWRNSDGALVAGPFPWNYSGLAGWITLDIPDTPILANTDYTVTVSTGDAGRNYAFLDGDLLLPGGNGLNLFYPAGAGVFSTTPGARPTQSFQNANYFRDIVFVPKTTPPPTNGPVTLTEFLADNESGLRDEDGDRSDWIELYNPSGTPVALGGYRLDAGAARWTFPETTLGAQEFLVIFASGKNRTNPPAPLHTNFQLDRAGESLALRDAEGRVLSQFDPAYPPQRADISCGPGPTGATAFFLTPTPGAPNSDSVAGLVDDLGVDIQRGFFTAPVTVTLTNATPGASIFFTVNGSEPSPTNGAGYTAPITLRGTTTLRARAFKPGYLPSKVFTGTYLFPADILGQSPASAQAYGWPVGPINGQELRLGIKPGFAALYSSAQMLAALQQIPSISVVTDQRHLTDPATGLYVNSAGSGPAWERPVSIELLLPDGRDGFQVDAGLRIRGGQSSSANFPKHSFHVFFRREYGAAALHFPLFGDAGARDFDTIDLRCEHGYAYADPYPYSDEFTAIRDVFCRDLWAATGFATTRSRPYHLYLNGQYWGLYQSQERAQEDYASTYFGGAPEEYDVIKATGLPQTTIEVANGDSTNWMRLWSGARAVAANPTDANYFALLGRRADGTRDPALPVLLDPRELAAYMLVHYYTGHADEPLSVSFNWERPNNFRAVRRRGLAEPWHFFVHDGESSMMAPEWFSNRANAVNLTSPNRANFAYSNPEWIHEDLMAHPDYRAAFWDEAQRLLFNDGPLTPGRAQPIWDGLAAQIDLAVIGESIRWGNDLTKARQSVWAAKIAQVRTNFFPTRTAMVLAQLRQRNQYPDIAAPTFNLSGGLVPAGFSVFLTNPAPAGIVFYALGGSDPRLHGGGLNPAALAYTPGTPIVLNGQTTITARVRQGSAWSAAVTAVFYTAQDFTRLLVTEIFYNPPDLGPTNGDNFEFLELKNAGPQPLDLGGISFVEGIAFNFTNGTVLAPGQFFVLARNPVALAGLHPGLAVHGTYSGKLDNAGERISLAHPLGARIFSFDYKNSGRWPVAPDGWGFSLVPRVPDENPDPGNPSQWRASTQRGGSPGADDPPAAIPPVLVNEALTHSVPPAVDAIELFNPAGTDVDLGGWFLTDDRARPRKFRIPAGTAIDALGFRVFTEADFNADPVGDTNSFSLGANGDQVYLFSADPTGQLTGYSHGFTFDGAAPGVTFGRHTLSTGEELFLPQTAPTLGAINAGPRIGPIVIRQIMYHPPDLPNGLDDSTTEYVELTNLSESPVPLFDPDNPPNTWRLRGGINFTFPLNIIVPPGDTLTLVGFDPSDASALAAFAGRYPRLRTSPILGPWIGKLDNSHDTLELSRPGLPTTNGIPLILVDAVSYRDATPWPVAADGSGAALRRERLGVGEEPLHWSAEIPLTIVLAPTNGAARPSSNVTFTVSALGEGSLTYRWLRNGTALENLGNFSGVDTPTLSIANLDATLRGDYSVRITDANGAGVSLPAELTVLIPPAIAIQPQPATVVQGDLLTLGILIADSAALPLTFEWRLGSTALVTNVVRSWTNHLTLRAAGTNTTVTNNYRVIVKNAANPNPGVASAFAPVVILRDTDGDHVPDAWMEQYFGHSTGLAGDQSRAGDDADGDGQSNLAEYLAGTDPRDSSSYLKLSIGIDGRIHALSFFAASNRSYTMQSRGTVTAGPWERWFDVAPAPTNRVISRPIDPLDRERYYRLVAPREP